VPREPQDTPAATPAVSTEELAAVEQRLHARVQDEMSRATEAVAALTRELNASLAPSTVYGQRLAHVLARRLQEVEGSVAVAMALAERTGVEFREELQQVADGLAEQLEVVASIAREAAAAPAATHQYHALEARFDDVHRRIDAVTRELRSGVASLERQSQFASPYGERLALTLGRRIESVEGAVAVSSALVERIGVEVREELSELAAAGEQRTAAVASLFDGLGERLERLEAEHSPADLTSVAETMRAELRAVELRIDGELTANRRQVEATRASIELALKELTARVGHVEQEREAAAGQLLRGAEAWAAERVALQERVAELAARIVTGPMPEREEGESEGAVWPFVRELDQLRIGMEGLRMRLAYHEKAVADLSGARDVDGRIDELHLLLRRLENAGQHVRDERETVLDQLERIATRMDSRLQQLETSAVAPDL
jgi:hypothetical protein